jgi:hypothetical protein
MLCVIGQMDIILLINVLLIAVFYLLKRTKEHYTAFYSFSLFLLILTSLYLFYRYGMRETPTTLTRVYFFSSPIILVSDFLMLYKQSKSSQGIGIKAYLQNILSADSKTRFNKILPAVLFYLSITIATYLTVNYYESQHPTTIPSDKRQWTFSLLHPLWQYIYIIPLTIMFWFMDLRKFTITLVVCSFIYPLVFILYGLLIGLLIDQFGGQ